MAQDSQPLEHWSSSLSLILEFPPDNLSSTAVSNASTSSVGTGRSGITSSTRSTTPGATYVLINDINEQWSRIVEWGGNASAQTVVSDDVPGIHTRPQRSAVAHRRRREQLDRRREGPLHTDSSQAESDWESPRAHLLAGILEAGRV